MAAFYRAFGICVLYTALGLVTLVNALDKTSPLATITPSPTASSVTYLSKTPTSSKHMTVTSTFMPSRKTTVTPSHNTTVMPTQNMTSTVTPSHNMTIMPYNSTVTPSHKTTVTPSHNTTVMPSQNITSTATPSHNMTTMPHNSTSSVAPSQSRTIMPSSTHQVLPTSSVHPLMPKQGNFTVKNNNGTTCLVADMAAVFDVTINSKESRILLPVNASASGECENLTMPASQPYINLRWNTMHGEANFTMHFAKYKVGVNNTNANANTSVQYWAAANLTFSLETGVGATASVHTFRSGTERLTQLAAELGHAFQCNTSTPFNLTAINSTVHLSLIDIEFQPFAMHDGQLSKKVDFCGGPIIKPTTPQKPTATPTGKTTPKPKKSHVVAIAVGCSLAGLVLIVIIGYVIGRRRRRNSSAGYRKL